MRRRNTFKHRVRSSLVARRQLEALREAEATLTEGGFAEAVLGDEANIYLIEGHADGMLSTYRMSDSPRYRPNFCP
jgi:hypothetical protein